MLQLIKIKWWIEAHRTGLKWLLGWLTLAALLTVIFFAGIHISTENANKLYHNEVAQCIRDNPVRVDFHKVASQISQVSKQKAEITTGAQRKLSLQASKEYGKVAYHLSHEQYAMHNGAINCNNAIDKP